MTYPPERITVKRRRDEDPVEALFIQRKKQMPSAFWKLVDDDRQSPRCAIPIASRNSVKETHATATAFPPSKVPTVRTTLPSEEFNDQENALFQSSANSKPSTDASAVIDEKCPRQSGISQRQQSHQNTQDFFTPTLKARKFHLVRGPSPLASQLFGPKTIAQRHRDKRKRELAVFAERPEFVRKAKYPDDVVRHSSGEPPQVDDNEKEVISLPGRSRKRPNATVAERKWRTETWANSSKSDKVNGNLTGTAENVNEPSNQWNYESIRLAEQLQGIALEEIRAGEVRAKGLSSTGQLKIKPKPPGPRRTSTERLNVDGSGKDIMTHAVSLDNDGDYVLDTYVRSSAQPFEVTEPATSQYESPTSINHGNVGILVIEDEEEEALWESFAVDQESDLEWNSEEEDENAEDYYGNDYPEDEIESDDEFGRGAYNYRHAASDDEEFDLSDEQ